MKVKRIFTKLILNGKIINKNFNFHITKQLGVLTEIAIIKVKKEYFEANNFNPKYKDKIEIFMQIDNEAEREIFSGVVLECNKNKTEYNIFAESEISFALLQPAKAKSYLKIDAKSILSEFCDSFDFDNNLNIIIERFIALNVQKRLVIKTLLSTIKQILDTDFYSFLEDKKLQVKKELKGKTYKIDDYIISFNETKITIFPLPQLSLQDKVSYEDKEYKIKTITMTNRNFTLEVS